MSRIIRLAYLETKASPVTFIVATAEKIGVSKGTIELLIHLSKSVN